MIKRGQKTGGHCNLTCTGRCLTAVRICFVLVCTTCQIDTNLSWSTTTADEVIQKRLLPAIQYVAVMLYLRIPTITEALIYLNRSFAHQLLSLPLCLFRRRLLFQNMAMQCMASGAVTVFHFIALVLYFL